MSLVENAIFVKGKSASSQRFTPATSLVIYSPKNTPIAREVRIKFLHKSGVLPYLAKGQAPPSVTPRPERISQRILLDQGLSEILLDGKKTFSPELNGRAFRHRPEKIYFKPKLAQKLAPVPPRPTVPAKQELLPGNQPETWQYGPVKGPVWHLQKFWPQ